MSSLTRLGFVFASAVMCDGYSVLAHRAVTDSLWASHIQPLLLKRFPQSTSLDLQRARAYVYGGSLIQDLGYVPLAPDDFSDLTHYVCSGEFVIEMLKRANTIDEYAFALGSLSHYAADKTGHPVINRLTPMLYPKTKEKFGDVVTYEDAPVAHLKAEFSLDVLLTARGLYAPDEFHQSIGFRVSRDLLERSFESTYGFRMKDFFRAEAIAIGVYKFSVSKIIPLMTSVAWQIRKDEIAKSQRHARPSRFGNEWRTSSRKPGPGARVIAGIFRVVPAVGPFKVLRSPDISPQAEGAFLRSLESTVAEYRRMLEQERAGVLKLQPDNLDTGAASRPGVYHRADRAYDGLLLPLAKKRFAGVSPALRENIAKFYATRPAGREEVRQALDQLRLVIAAR